MELFDIVKNIFSQDNKKWSTVSRNDKSRNFFMVNRITVDLWRNNLSSRYTKPPHWLYTKVVKSGNKAKKENGFSCEEVEIFVRDRYSISKRDLSDLRKFYPEKYDSWMKSIADQIGIKNKSRNEEQKS